VTSGEKRQGRKKLRGGKKTNAQRLIGTLLRGIGKKKDLKRRNGKISGVKHHGGFSEGGQGKKIKGPGG